VVVYGWILFSGHITDTSDQMGVPCTTHVITFNYYRCQSVNVVSLLVLHSFYVHLIIPSWNFYIIFESTSV